MTKLAGIGRLTTVPMSIDNEIDYIYNEIIMSYHVRDKIWKRNNPVLVPYPMQNKYNRTKLAGIKRLLTVPMSIDNEINCGMK